MNGYHRYILSKERRISNREHIDCASDADALTKAAFVTQWTELFPEVEVWNGERLVGRVRLHNGGG